MYVSLRGNHHASQRRKEQVKGVIHEAYNARGSVPGRHDGLHHIIGESHFDNHLRTNQQFWGQVAYFIILCADT